MATLTLDDWRARIEAMGAGGFGRVVGKVMRANAFDAEAIAKAGVTAGGFSGLKVRTGRLRQSIAGRYKAGPAVHDIVLSAGGARAGKEVRYAAIHEYGGTVRPKNGRYLRIPMGAAVTGAGVDRFTTPLRQSGAGLFRVQKAEDGRLFLVKTVGKGKGQPWYRLVTSARIPARPYLHPTIERVKLRIGPDIVAAAVKAVGGA